MKLSTKLVAISAATALGLGLSSVLVVQSLLPPHFDRLAREDLIRTHFAVQAEIEALQQRLDDGATLAAARPDLAEPLRAGDDRRLRHLADEISAACRVPQVLFVRPDGSRLAGTAPALALRPVTERVDAASPRRIRKSEGEPLVFQSVGVVRAKDEVVGAIVLGVDLSSTHEFADHVKERYGAEFTFFFGDTRATTTILKEGKRILGTRMDNPAVIDTVLKKGGRFQNVNNILGRPYTTVYWPLRANEGIAGMAFLGKTRENIEEAHSQVVRRLVLTIAAIAFLASLANIALARWLTRKLALFVARLGQAGRHVEAMGAEVTAASRSLAESARDQSASANETSASLRHVAAASDRNAGDAKLAKSLALEARTAAANGADGMKELNAAIKGIEASSANIAQISKTVEEIALQTSILALNAAVEAARAGSAGTGFSVVADEVRSLAQRSAEAAKETAAKIEDTVRRIHDGAVISARVSGALEEISAKTREVDDLAGSIRGASQEQSDRIGKVNTAVDQIDSAARSSAASAEQTAAAAKELNGEAAVLEEAVLGLTRLMDGADGKAAPANPSPASRSVHAPRFRGSERELTAAAAGRTSFRPPPR